MPPPERLPPLGIQRISLSQVFTTLGFLLLGLPRSFLPRRLKKDGSTWSALNADTKHTAIIKIIYY